MKIKAIRVSFWSVLFVLSILFITTSIHASATTVNNVKDYLPSLGYQYDMYQDGNMSASCEDITYKDTYAIESKTRACDTNGMDGVSYYYDEANWRVAQSGSDYFFSEHYSFPMTAGKTYKKITEGPDGYYSYSYTVESVNSTVNVENKTYTDVIRIKNEMGGYTYIAKNHGAIFISSNYDGKLKTIYKVVDYKKLVTTKKYTTKAALNVRTGAGTKYKKLGVLKKGATVTVKGTKGSWYKVSYKGKIGYVSKSYVKVTTVKKTVEQPK